MKKRIFPELTEREEEVAIAYAHIDSKKAVAEKLGITERTVESHTVVIRAKLKLPAYTMQIPLRNLYEERKAALSK